MRIVVTIPAYNEEKTIEKVINDIHKIMKIQGYDYQILVVNDGSTDKTAILAQNAGAIVVTHQRNFGLAAAFNTEMKKCLELKADLIIHTDADGQYRAQDIPLLIKKFNEGYDLVLGSRFAGTIEEMPFLKRLGNKAFTKVISRISHYNVTDAQTGFRAFNKEIAAIPINSNFTYTQEQIIRAARERYRITEIPVFFAKRNKTQSRLMKNPFDYAIKAWINLIRIYRDYEPLKFFGLLGMFFIFLGTAFAIWILYNLIRFGSVGGIPRVILCALFITTGIQIILFGFLADMKK